MIEAEFQANGFAVVPVFDQAEVKAAQADIVAQIDRLSHALYLPFEESFPEVPLGRRLDRLWQHNRSQADLLRVAICTDAHRGPRLSALAAAPDLRRIAERLGGCTLGERVVRVRASIGAFPQHLHDWHSDVARDDGTSCSRVRVTAWIPLSDAGPDGGGLELAPGRRSAPLPHREDRGFTIEESTLADASRVRPHCPAGSVVFLDRFTPHRSLPPGPEARFALVVWMQAA
jgi:hypothetical protein